MKMITSSNRWRVTVITRRDRKNPFQLEVRDRLTGEEHREGIRDLEGCTRRTRREADSRAAALEADLNAGRAACLEAVSWDRFRDDYLADLARRCRRASVYEARSVLGMFAAGRRPETIAAVTASDVTGFLVSRPGISGATGNKYLRTLGAAFEWAVAQKFIPANPCTAIKTAKVDRTPPRVMTDAGHRERLLAALGKVGADWATVADLILATGLRVGEVSHLTWRSVDLSERWLKVQPEPDGGGSLIADWSRTWGPKNHNTGELALDADMVGALTDLKVRARYDLTKAGMDAAEVDRLLEPDVSRGSSIRVFGRANADGWAKDFRATIKAACRAARVPAVGPHDLRRTFATILARAGLDPLALKTVMRHAKIETTEKFYVDMDRKRAATRALDCLHRDDETE
jgi:integrase